METGRKLGPYEIVEQIGKGGMGEVYLAEDTRLGRKVAIKVLPPEFASDPERLARFEQEARAAAALNHPHIAAVFDVGFEDDTHFMVQEYLEGKTLRAALEAGPLPQEKALALGTEIAQALRVAHRAGIVHRDLKPENVFVTEDGHAKVLDFGLAKLTEMASGAMNSQSMSPTVLGTQAGSIMGTAGYMAPEQVRGEEVDHRADIFALGCVLFEVLTGTRAFAGKSPPHTLHKILDEDPDNFDGATAEMPLRLRWLLEKCLAKDVESRTQSAGDAMVDLQRVAREVESGTAIGAGGLAGGGMAVAAETSRGLSRAAALALAAVAVVAGVLGGRFFPAPEVAPEPIAHFEFGLFGSDSGFTNPGSRPLSISRDGSAVAFGDEGLVRLRRFESPALMDVRGTDSPRTPIFSPDGQWIAFHSGGKLQKVPLTGGAAISLASVGNPAGMRWESDGFIILAVADVGIVRVSENGGEPEVLIEQAEGEQLQGPSLFPGGEWILFSSLEGGSANWSDAQVVAQSLVSGERRVLVPAGVEARYVGTGHVTFASEGNLLAVPFDADAMAVTGGPVPLIEGIGMATSGGAYYDLTASGDLVYYGLGGGGGDERLAWYDLDGGLVVLPFDPADLERPRLGPAGDRIAVAVVQDGGLSALWIYDIARRATQRLTAAGVVAAAPAWSPDGQWIYFVNGSEGDTIWRIAADFSGIGEPIADGTVHGWPYDVSPDGATLLVGIDGDNFDIATVDLETGEVEILLGTPAFEVRPEYSPDGRFVAYVSNESGELRVYVLDRESGRRHVASTGLGGMPVWSPDGSTLYYNSLGTDTMMSMPVTYEPSFRLGSPVEMFAMPGQLPFQRADLDISPDGQRFLLATDSAADLGAGGVPERSMIQVVLNWGQVLRERVTSR